MFDFLIAASLEKFVQLENKTNGFVLFSDNKREEKRFFNSGNIMSSQKLIEKKNELIQVIQDENILLDKILNQQNLLHECVKEKNWDKLNENIENLQNLSDRFSELEEKRAELAESVGKDDAEIRPVLSEVRGKLQRSKIENKALNEYISTTRKFLQGVFDSVVPQRRNKRYSEKGEIIKPELSSVVVNQLM